MRNRRRCFRLPPVVTALALGWLVLAIMSTGCMSNSSIEKEALAGESGPVPAPGDYTRELTVDGRERSYLLHVPSGYDGSRGLPVVLNFHGGGGNPKTQQHTTMMDRTADREGFLVVYPQGTNGMLGKLRKGFTWNAGSCCGWAAENDIDDVRFTAKLLDDLAGAVKIDPKRVYATGISNGAIMSYRLACELSDRIAAIAPVAGTLGLEQCRPERPVPVMHFHGTADQFAPYEGGAGERSLPGQDFTSVEQTMKTWLDLLGLDQGPEQQTTKGRATKIVHRSPDGSREFILWRLQGAGHTWPGGQFGFLGERVLGPMTQDISASEQMWKFFQHHALP